MVSILPPTLTSREKDQSSVEFDDHECSDPAVNSDPLPDNHPIHLLKEAQEFYSSSRTPPFVLNKRSEVIRVVVLPTKSGLRPKDGKATKAKVVAKPWDKERMFWTLDINGIRYIVKPFNGQAQGGMRYLYWAGPRRAFERKPLALSFISTSQPGATTSTRGNGILPDRSTFVADHRKRSVPTYHSESSDSLYSSDSSDGSDSEAGKESRGTLDLAQRGANAGSRANKYHHDDKSSDHGDHSTSQTSVLRQPAATQGAPAKRRKTEVSSDEVDQLYRLSPPARRQSDVPLEEPSPASVPHTTSLPTKSVNDREEKRKQAAIARIEKELGRKFHQIFTPWAGEDQDVSRNTLRSILKVVALMDDSSPQKISRTLNKALNGGDGKPQPAGGRKPIGQYFTQLATDLQSIKAASVNGEGPPCPLGSNLQQQVDSRSVQRPEAESVQINQLDLRRIQSDGSRHHENGDPDWNVSPSMALPRHKQARTTLIVRVAPSVEYLPLKLGECMTHQAFYSSVLGAWNIRPESVAKMTVTFTWMDPTDKMRTMIMNSQMEGCFAHLIEQVDEAPSWTEAPEVRGKCVLDVDIVLQQ